MFVLTSDITIGSFRFSGVNEVQINKSIHSIVETATIRIPSIAKLIKNGKVSPGSVTTGNQFKEGDPVVIRLGYNGELKTEFVGFVRRCDLNMPLVVECEGYSWLLRRNNISGFYSSIRLIDLLKLAVSGLEGNYTIAVQCDVDLEISNVQLNNVSGFKLLDSLATFTDGCLSCFFTGQATLWCGYVYTPYAKGVDNFGTGVVKYRLGYNTMKENDLKVRDVGSEQIAVNYIKKRTGGAVVSETSNVFSRTKQQRTKILNHVKDARALSELANEQAYRINYSGCEGSFTTFLDPYAMPGQMAHLEDRRYPERYGKYLVESVQVNYGIHGARRVVEIGPGFGFAK